MTNPSEPELVELLPCPWCETKPERLSNLDHSDSNLFWHPDRDVDCIIGGCSIHSDKWEAWNTRMPRAASEEVVEALRDARAYIAQKAEDSYSDAEDSLLEQIDAALAKVNGDNG